jgi:hypothetical protein
MTSKLHWNSVLSTQKAKYMCLDMKNIYLSAPLDRYKYMCILIGLSPPWIIEQYKPPTKCTIDTFTLKCAKSGMGSSSGRYLGKQAPAKETCPPWEL